MCAECAVAEGIDRQEYQRTEEGRRELSEHSYAETDAMGDPWDVWSPVE
ncbi:hypothetical protein [Streptomyces sp. NPDC002644]